MSRAGPGRIPIASLLLAATALAACAAQDRPAEPQQTAAPGAYLVHGKRLLAINEPEAAFDAFMASIRVDGVSAEALVGAGIAAQKQGLLTASRRYLEQAARIDPASVAAHNDLGVVLFLLKEYYPARDAFRVAFALSSGTSEIAERNLNRADAVVAEIEQAGQEDPEISHRVVRLGTSAFRITPVGEPPAEMIGAE